MIKQVLPYGNCLKQVDGPLPDSVLGDEDLLRVEQLVGCSDKARSFEMSAKEYLGTRGPLELVVSSGWLFDNDTRGSAGLIGFSGAFASFHLPCAGEAPILDIGYLHSYEGMGVVEVTMSRLDSDLKTSIIIDSLWKSRASVVSHQVIGVPPGVGAVLFTIEILSQNKEKAYPDIAHKSKAMLRANRKFKVTSMQCC